MVGGPADGLHVRLRQFPLTLGREGDPAVPVGDRWASRHHCELFAQEGQLFIRDLASKHGTYVNGALIDERALEVGDRVVVGLSAFAIDEIASEFGEVESPQQRASGVGA